MAKDIFLRTMQDVLEPVCLAADGGDDPLGMREVLDDPITIANATVHDARIGTIVKEALSGLGDRRDAVMTSCLARDDEGILDDIAAAMLAARGVDPLMIAWLCLTTQRAFNVVVDGATFAEVFPDDNIVGCVIRLDQATTWHDDGEATVRLAGATMANAITGLPLARVLSHPVLDLYDLHIEQVDEWGVGELHLTTGRGRSCLGATALRTLSAEMEPTDDRRIREEQR